MLENVRERALRSGHGGPWPVRFSGSPATANAPSKRRARREHSRHFDTAAFIRIEQDIHSQAVCPEIALDVIFGSVLARKPDDMMRALIVRCLADNHFVDFEACVAQSIRESRIWLGGPDGEDAAAS